MIMTDLDNLVDFLVDELIPYRYFQFALGAQIISLVGKDMNFNFDANGKILYLDRLPEK